MNILLIDDHILFAKSLAIALEGYTEIENFYTTQDMHTLLNTVQDKKIDVLLIDIHLGNLSSNNGLQVAQTLHQALPDVKIIMLTGHDLPVYQYEAQKIGISGFLNKNISPDKLVNALLEVYKGQTCFSSNPTQLIIEELTPTEQHILQLVATGKKRKDLAHELYISERTLSNHLQHIYEKLHVTSSIEAVTKALQMGYISTHY